MLRLTECSAPAGWEKIIQKYTNCLFYMQLSKLTPTAVKDPVGGQKNIITYFLLFFIKMNLYVQIIAVGPACR